MHPSQCTAHQRALTLSVPIRCRSCVAFSNRLELLPIPVPAVPCKHTAYLFYRTELQIFSSDDAHCKRTPLHTNTRCKHAVPSVRVLLLPLSAAWQVRRISSQNQHYNACLPALVPARPQPGLVAQHSACCCVSHSGQPTCSPSGRSQ